MRKLIRFCAVVAIAGAFGFAGVAEAAPGGNGKGKNKNRAITASVSAPVECVALDGGASPVKEIEAGKDEPQCFSYTITLPGGPVAAAFEDMLQANFDPDSGVEDASNAAAQEDVVDAADQEDGLDGNVDGSCTDGVCNGDVGNDGTAELAFDGLCTNGATDDTTSACDGSPGFATDGDCTDGTDSITACDGIVVESTGTCSAFVTRPDSHVKLNSGNIPAKQVEFIAMQYDGTLCTVTVFATTVGNPGSVVFVGGAEFPDSGATFDTDGSTAGDGVDDPKEPNCLLGGEIIDCVDSSLGQVLFSVFEPASCRYVRFHTRYDSDEDSAADVGSGGAGDVNNDGFVDLLDALAGILQDGDIIYTDYVALNRGVKQWNTDGTMQLESNNVPTTDLTSIQLKPNNCDADLDGVFDFIEMDAGTDPLDPADN